MGPDVDDTTLTTCIGRPVPGMIVNSVVYPIRIEFLDGGDRIAIRSEFFDEERIVHMDGRPHPYIDQRFQTGYSIGTLEDRELFCVPDHEPTRFDCDIESTRRFVPE